MKILRHISPSLLVFPLQNETQSLISLMHFRHVRLLLPLSLCLSFFGDSSVYNVLSPESHIDDSLTFLNLLLNYFFGELLTTSFIIVVPAFLLFFSYFNFVL